MRLLSRDGEIDYQEAFLTPAAARQWFDQLALDMDWHDETLRLFGRDIRVPRRVAWHGDAGTDYRYAGVTHAPRPWTPALRTLKAAVEEACGQRFNSVLGNLYRDGRDAMGWHADNEPELGCQPLIASLSLGAERRFEIRHRTTRETLRLPLASGSLLIMGGAFQAYWQHRIPRQPGITEPRINLTFRWIQTRN